MPEHTRWFIPYYGSRRPSQRLFCFPYAGAGASVFSKWRSHFPDEVEICAIQLPGREGRLREPLFSDLPALIEELSPALKAYFDLPFAFFGSSMGAMVAFELARHLRDKCAPLPQSLIVAASPAPTVRCTIPKTSMLSDEEFITHLQELGGTSDGVARHSELMHLILPGIRADFRITETYNYVEGPPLALPIVSIHGANDAQVRDADQREWSAQTSVLFRHYSVPGGHFFICSHLDPAVRIVREVVASGCF